MKITDVRTIPMSDPVPRERQHRTDFGTKVKSDAVLILVETDDGLTGMGASLGSPETVSAIVKYDLAPTLLGGDPMCSELLWEKMYNGSRWKPALERGHSSPPRPGVALLWRPLRGSTLQSGTLSLKRSACLCTRPLAPSEILFEATAQVCSLPPAFTW